MPFKIRSASMRGAANTAMDAIPATDEDKALLVRSNTHPPGIRGLLSVSTDPIYKVVILIISLITYFCVMLDFAIALGTGDYRVMKMTPMQEGTLRDYIFCFDFIYLVDLLLSICHKKAKLKPSRLTFVIAIDILSYIPYEMIYIGLTGTNAVIFFGLRLRYLFRFVRYVADTRVVNRFKLSLMYVITVHFVLMSCACVMAVCIRIHILCNVPSMEPEYFTTMRCVNLTSFDFYFTYVILNAQVTQSGMIFAEEPYAILTNLDGIFQIGALIVSYVFIPKLICILMETYAHKYTFCMAGNLVMESIKGNKGKLLQDDQSMPSTHMLSYVYAYMNSYWNHYQIESLQSSYIRQFKVATIPSVIYSEITLDITWNMFKHSLLFRDESTAFLRQVSKLTVFNFGAKNDILHQQGNFRYSMIYIIKGIVSLMSETTGRGPLISFSGGTCFGELSLFMIIPSATTIFCSTYCEYMVLTRQNFQKLRRIYPVTYNKLRMACMKRIALARNYDFIGREMYDLGEIKLPKSKTSMRYIKATIRKFTSTQNSPQRDRQRIFIPPSMRPEATYPKTIFNASFIPLYVLANEKESILTTHFTHSGWNFKLKPTSTLHSIWTFLISVLALIDNLYYPIGASLDVPLFTNFYDYFVIVLNIFYIIDFISFNFIAVKMFGKFIIDSEMILMHKIQTANFWLDFISSIPVEILMELMQGPFPPSTYRLMGINRLIKILKLVTYFKHRLFYKVQYMLLIQLAKSVYVLLMLLFFGYLTFHRSGYFDYCYDDFTTTFGMKLCIVYQFYFSMSEVVMIIDRDVNILPMIMLQAVASFFITLMFCSNAASMCLIYMPTVEYENKIDDMKRIFVLYKFPLSSRKKMAKIMNMHYCHGKGFYLTEKSLYLKMMGTSLFKMHRVNMYYNFISSLGLFREMPKPLINSLCEVGNVVLIPHGEIIVMAGSMTTHFYFIMAGSCQYLSKAGATELRYLVRGDAILMLEGLLCHNALSNVIAVTDCQLLCVPMSELRRKLTKYPAQKKLIDDTLNELFSNRELNRLLWAEPHVYAAFEEGESCRYFTRQTKSFKQGFGNFRFLHMFFMSTSITPYGRFWLAWEICHIIVTYAYCLFGMIPNTIDYDFRSYWFWLCRILDLFYLVDMYFRLHLIYFNECNIEVQHPWKLTLHYLKTNFVVDFVATIPFELIVLPCIDTIHLSKLILLRINRYMRIYRFFGIKKFLNFRFMKTNKLEIILSYTAGLMLLFNILYVVLFTPDVEIHIIDRRPHFKYISYYDFWLTTLMNMKMAIRDWCNIGIFEGFSTDEQLWRNVLLNAVGLLIVGSLSNILIAMSLFRRNHLMTCQIKMKRLIMFMNIRKIDKTVRNEIIKHYEHLWTLREGRGLLDTLNLFHSSANEEIIYSYYAPILQRTILFYDYPKVVLKDLLTAETINRVMILITGIVLRVNDVQDKIFILFNGTVEVLGPDYNYLRELRVGSVFGCLDNVPLHRSTLTYVAKTHCEFLCIPSKHYHEIMRRYPRYYKFYMRLMKSSNLDYIPCSTTVKRRFRYANVDTTVRRVNKVEKFLAKLFPVMNQRKYVRLGFTIFIAIAFQFECVLITYLNMYFAYVVYIAYLFDIIFWIKIYFDFSTAYEDEYGLKITKRKLIAIRYIRDSTGFIFHLLVNFPFEILVLVLPKSYNAYWNMIWANLRFNRLLKIVLVFKYLRSVKQRLNINLGLIRVLDIFLTLFATAQFSIVFLSYEKLYYNIPYLSSFIMHSYFISKKLYTPFGIAMDESTIFTDEIFYTAAYIIILLTTQLVCMHVMGEFVSTYRMQHFSRFRYETFLNNQAHVMQLMGVSVPLFERVKLYCRRLIQSELNVQFPSFVINAPYYLREALLDCMFGFHLRQHPVFKRCHMDFIRQVASTFKTSYYFEGDFITFQNDIDTKMYFIHSGEVEGLIDDNLYFDVADSKFIAGDYFGFHQLIFTHVGHSRTYKVVSTKAIVLSLKKHYVLSLLEFFPASKFIFYNSDAVNDELENADVVFRDYLKHTKGSHE